MSSDEIDNNLNGLIDNMITRKIKNTTFYNVQTLTKYQLTSYPMTPWFQILVTKISFQKLLASTMKIKILYRLNLQIR